MHLLFISLLSIFSSFSVGNSLPDLGNETAGFTNQQEMVLGKTWLRGFRRSVDELNSPLLIDYLNKHIQNLKQYTTLHSAPISHIVIDDRSLNAFAVPGHIMGINSGLFLTAGDETQFLSVISHELAHLELKHFNQQVNKQADIQGLQLITIISTMLAAQYSINMGEAILASGMASAQSQALSYSRSLETEADRRATIIMKNAGYPANSVHRMLNSLMKQGLNISDAAPEYFRTHPLSESRVADSLSLESMTDIVDENSIDYELILLMLSSHHGFPSLRSINKPSNSAKIAKALFEIDNLLATSQFNAAKSMLDSIPVAYRSETAFQVRLANYYHGIGNTRQALETVSTNLALTPKSVRLIYLKAKLLKDLGQISSATQTLRELASEQRINPWLWQKTLEYAEVGGKPWQQLEAGLHYKWLSGEDQAALRMIENNLYSEKWTAVEKSRLKDWLEQYRAEINLIEKTF